MGYISQLITIYFTYVFTNYRIKGLPNKSYVFILVMFRILPSNTTPQMKKLFKIPFALKRNKTDT